MALVALLTLLACGESSITTIDVPDPGDTPVLPPSLSEAQLAVVSGNDQEGEVDALLADPLVVRVLDGSGEPFPNAPVQWIFSQGAGRVGNGQPSTQVTTFTDAAGIASVQWQMGIRSGVQSASAEIPAASTVSSEGPAPAPGSGNGKKVGFGARAKPGEVSDVTVSPSQATLAVGDSMLLSAAALDRFGNVLEAVEFQWRSTDETVSQVTQSGMVYALAEGSSTNVAKYKSVEGSSAMQASSSSQNLPPNASISSPSGNTTIVLGETVTFLGSASDADGSVTSHQWDFGDGNTASVEDPGVHSYQAVGVYEATYQVMDDAGATSNTASRTVTVTSAANSPPSVSIVSPSGNVTVAVGEAVDFRGSASDSDGTIVSHSWTFGDGRTASVRSPGNRSYSTAGAYTVTYHATDDDGATSTVASRLVTVTEPTNSAPVASIVTPSSNVTVNLGDAVSFAGSASDSDGQVVGHDWSFGDGNGASVEDPGAHTYASTGVYSVTYQVTDNDGATSSIATRTITVQDPTPPSEATAVFSSTFEGSDITDNGKWMRTMGFLDPSVARIFGTSVDSQVPGGRGLRIMGPEGDNFWLNFMPSVEYRPSVPAVGESITWRWYWKWVRGDGDGQYHPVAFGGNTVSPPTEGAVISYMEQGNGILPWIQPYHGGGTPDFQPRYESNGRMKPGIWYRQELTWTRTGNSTWRMKYRVYDPAGNVLYTERDLYDNYGGGSTNLGSLTMNQPNANFATEWTGFGNGVNENANPHEQDRWAAIVAVMGDVENIPYPIDGESR